MANDDTVGIGVDLDIGGLGREANEAAAVFTKMLLSIEGMSKALSSSVAISKQMGDTLALNAVNFKKLEEAQRNFVKEQRESLKAQQEGTKAAQQRIIGGVSPNGGTIRDDQLKQFGTKALITSLGASDPQLEAQLKEAAGKLAERLIRTTEEAMRASFNRAVQAQANTQLNFGSATSLQANRVASEYSRIKKDEANAPYASGADRVLDEREQAFMRQARRAAEAENVERDRAAKKAAIAQWVEANETNARLDAQARFRARQVAEAEATVKKTAMDQFRAATEENREFDRKARFERNRLEGLARQEKLREAELLKAANNELAAATEENREFDRRDAYMRRQRSLADKDNRAFDKSARQTGLAQYGEASAENKRFDEAAKNASLLQRAQAEERNKLIEAELTFRARETRKAADLENRRFEEDLNFRARETRKAAELQNKQFDLANKPGRSFGERVGARAQLATDYVAIGAAFAGITATVRGVVALDDALEKFAAITQTSNTEMTTFSAGLLKLGESSRYSVKDLAEVATTLGQTGLSAAEVLKVLPNVTNLATAAGSSLQEAVDVTASIIGAYNMSAKQTGDVSNILTGALNQTKLTMSQLQQGFSYSSNVAKEAGVSFTELTAVLGGLAQAGVRSGSTLGTGTRQLIQELSAPSDKLLAVLRPLGISLADIDLKANGLTGALDNLRAKGFTTADALRALDLRAASAFTALVGQTDTVKNLQESLLLSNAASEGAAKASESLSAGFTRLGNTAFSVVDQAMKPVVTVLKSVVDAFAAGLSMLTPFGTGLAVVGGALASLGTAFAALKIVSVVSGLGQALTAITALTTGVGGLSVALGALTLSNPIVLAAAIAAAGAFAIYATSADDLTSKLDKLREKQNELSSATTQNVSSTTQISSTIDNLIERREKLNSDPILRRVAIIEAQKAFGDLGLSVKAGATNIDELIVALRNLRGELATELPAGLEKRLALARQEIELLTKKADKDNGSGFLEQRRADTFNERVAGGQLNGVLSFLQQKPSEIDTNDVRGQTGPLLATIRDLKKQFEGNGPAQKVLEEIGARLNEKIEKLSNIQSKKLGAEQLDTQARVSIVSAHTGVQDLAAQKEDLYSELRSGTGAIQRDETTSATEKLAKLKALGDSIKERARTLITDLTVVEAAMIANGNSSDDVKAALAPLRDAVSGLTKAPLAIIESVRKTVDAYNAITDSERKRANAEGQRAVQQAARSARTPAQLDAAAEMAKELIEAERKLEVDAKTREFADPDKLTDENKEALKAIADRFKDKLEASTQDFAEKRLKMLENFFEFERKALGAEGDRIQSEISELRKLINDPSTTVAKAKELQEQINKLIQKGIDIVSQQSSLELQKSMLGNAGGQQALSPGASAVQQMIADTLSKLGRTDRLGTALAFGQQESGFDPNRPNAQGSGAMGLFQFMPKTWAQYGQGSMTDVGEQVKAFVKYMDVIDGALRKVLGRDPSDFERYVGWQQGEGGGAKLLSANPNSRAADVLGSADKVTMNGGTANMSVADFLNVIKGQFQAAEKVTLGLSKKIDTDEAARAKGRATEQGTARDVDTKEFRAKSVQAGLDQKGDEAAIKAKTAGIALTDSSAAAEKLTLEIVGMLAGELKRQLALIEADPKYRNDPEAKAAAIASTRESFAERFNRLAPANAKNAADQDQAVLQKKLDILETDRKTRAEAGLSTGEMDKQIYALQQRLSLTEPLVVKERELAVLNAQIAAAKENGLGDEKTLADAVERQAVLQREILALKQKQGIATKNLASNPDFGEAFKKGSQDFFKNAGMLNADGNFKSFTQEMSGYWTEALGGMQSGMSTLFKNLASGTMKAGDAFKQFAQSVIGNMLDIASKAVSNEILKMLFGGAQSGGGSLLSSIFGGGGGASNIATSGDMGFFAHGGVVRAATGYSTPTRDSKLIMVQPGEGIVRKSAMEMLGSQGLDEVNVMANRTLSKSQMGSAIPRPRTPDNVNVWVAAPDQIPPPGPKDIIHVISSDIQNRGNIRQLIRSVQLGTA